MNVTDLPTFIADATSLRVTRVGELDLRHRDRAKPLLVTSEVAALTRLRAALAIDPESLSQQIALMTPGVLDLHFFAGHEMLATVTFVPPDSVRCQAVWGCDARLREPARLASWLTEHGWLGGVAFTPQSSLP